MNYNFIISGKMFYFIRDTDIFANLLAMKIEQSSEYRDILAKQQ